MSEWQAIEKRNGPNAPLDLLDDRAFLPQKRVDVGGRKKPKQFGEDLLAAPHAGEPVVNQRDPQRRAVIH